ncbi:hypothetical protein [Periweissella beninensis]|uniref:hypothetical protein n=1 Tax=Periweissella beninensis TaxID=504936 RepID=UPI0021A88F1D|nr:hypothetical protein [Periweissella beninensis]MCT4395968.1 hypothetical protein [Periweissella beninensis]
MKFNDYWKKSALQQYSKFFRGLYLLFWPVLLVILITVMTGLFNHVIALVATIYVAIFMLTFFIESMHKFVKTSYEHKQNKVNQHKY